MNMTTARTAPRNVRMSRASPERLAEIDTLVARGRALEQRGGAVTSSLRPVQSPRMTASADESAGASHADRIAALEARCDALEQRVEQLEQEEDALAGHTPAGNGPDASAATRSTPQQAILNSREITARMNAGRLPATAAPAHAPALGSPAWYAERQQRMIAARQAGLR